MDWGNLHLHVSLADTQVTVVYLVKETGKMLTWPQLFVHTQTYTHIHTYTHSYTHLS